MKVPSVLAQALTCVFFTTLQKSRRLVAVLLGLTICSASPFQVFAQVFTLNPPPILTPPAPATPQINGAKVFGVRPGSPFFYTIAATGKRPMRFAATPLPDGLRLDGATGRITGILKQEGEYIVTLRADNSLGKAERALRIVAGDQIALTPPLGWNSWNCWGDDVSQEKVLAASHAFVDKGLIHHGWTYINIDDGWQGVRGGPYNAIQPNAKFPSIEDLSRKVHGMGLKLGIYSTPWRGSYAGYIGSSCDNEDGAYDWIKAGQYSTPYKYPKDEKHGHRKDNYVFGKYSFIDRDVKQWADWGVDYVKYDWNPVKVPEIKAMHDALRATPRDMVYSLSNGLYFNWASEYPALANQWRIGGDIVDTWDSLKHIGFSRKAWQDAPLGNDKWAPYVGPGHFIDPDMLVIGHVGWGKPHPTRLTPDEQYAHISLWCLLSAPLILGCDPDKLDDFSVSLLTNDEVLDIDQDPLCKQATMVGGTDDLPVYAKRLEDGSWAVGLFNLSGNESLATVQWNNLHLQGKQIVRDLWRQKDLGVFEGRFQAKVASHGVVLVRIRQ
jgi:alpha-galactosidase